MTEDQLDQLKDVVEILLDVLEENDIVLETELSDDPCENCDGCSETDTYVPIEGDADYFDGLVLFSNDTDHSVTITLAPGAKVFHTEGKLTPSEPIEVSENFTTTLKGVDINYSYEFTEEGRQQRQIRETIGTSREIVMLIEDLKRLKDGMAPSTDLEINKKINALLKLI